MGGHGRLRPPSDSSPMFSLSAIQKIHSPHWLHRETSTSTSTSTTTLFQKKQNAFSEQKEKDFYEKKKKGSVFFSDSNSDSVSDPDSDPTSTSTLTCSNKEKRKNIVKKKWADREGYALPDTLPHFHLRQYFWSYHLWPK